jgi:hypothetical protein
VSRLEKLAFLAVFALAAAIAWPTFLPSPLYEVAKNQGPNIGLGFTRDGRYLVTRTYDDIQVHSTADGHLVAGRREWSGKRNGFASIALSPRSDAIACEDVVYALPSLEPKGQLPGFAIGFAPDGDTIAVLRSDVLLVSAKTGEIKATLPGANAWQHLSFSPDGALVAGFTFSNVTVFATANGAVQTRIATTETSAFAFTGPDELLVANYNGGLEARSAKDGSVRRVILPDGTDRERIRRPGLSLRDVFAMPPEIPRNLQKILEAGGSTLGLDRCALSPDGSLIAASSEDTHSVTVWRR